jgi:hypothetical protein
MVARDLVSGACRPNGSKVSRNTLRRELRKEVTSMREGLRCYVIHPLAWAFCGAVACGILLTALQSYAEPIDTQMAFTPATGPVAGYKVDAVVSGTPTEVADFPADQPTVECPLPASPGQQCHTVAVTLERGTGFRAVARAYDATGATGPDSDPSAFIVAGETGSILPGQPGQLYLIIPVSP